MRGRHLIVWTATWWALTGLATAHAQSRPAPATTPLEAVIESVDPCLSPEALGSLLAAWLGRSEVDARIHIVVAVDGGSSAHIDLVVDGAHIAERRFADLPLRCPERAAAVSLAIALAIDSIILAALQELDEAPPRPLDGPLAIPELERTTADGGPGPRRTPRDRLRITLGGGGGWGLPGEGSFGGAVGFAWLPGTFLLGVRAEARGSVALDVVVDGGTVSRDVLSGGLLACLRFVVGRDWMLRELGALEVCGGAHVGRSLARGRGFDVDRSLESPFGLAELRVGGSITLAYPLSLELAGSVGVPWWSARYTVIDGGTTLTSVNEPPVSVWGSVGLAVDLDL